MIQKRQKYKYTVNNHVGWCSIGLFSPAGSHLKFRFFIGSSASPLTEVYWDEGVLTSQVHLQIPQLTPGDLVDILALESTRCIGSIFFC